MLSNRAGRIRADAAAVDARLCIRRMRISDIPGVAACARACSPPLDRYPDYFYRGAALTFGPTCLVAWRGPRIVGFIVALPSMECADSVFLWQIGVMPSSRRDGVGAALLARLFKTTARLGRTRVRFSRLPTTRAMHALALHSAAEAGWNLRRIPAFIGEGASREEIWELRPCDRNEWCRLDQSAGKNQGRRTMVPKVKRTLAT